MDSPDIKTSQPTGCREANPQHCAFNDPYDAKETIQRAFSSLKGPLFAQAGILICNHSCIHCGLEESRVITADSRPIK